MVIPDQVTNNKTPECIQLIILFLVNYIFHLQEEDGVISFFQKSHSLTLKDARFRQGTEGYVMQNIGGTT